MKTFLEKIQKIIAKFLSGTLYFQNSSGAVTQTISGHPFDYWIVPRDFCFFENFDLSMVPENKRPNALENEIKAVAPYNEYSYSVQWYENSAGVWIWDRGLQSEAQRKAGVGEGLEAFAESSFLPKKDNGFFGYQGAAGFFLQYWRDSTLLAEISWPSKPDAEAVSWFFQSYDIGMIDKELVWEPVEFKFSSRGAWEKQSGAIRNNLLIFGVSVFFFLFSYQFTGWLRAEIELGRVNDAVSALKSEKGESIRLRRAVDKESKYTTTLERLFLPKQIELIQLVYDTLPEESGNLLVWEFDGELLELLFQTPANEPSEMVAKLEATSRFEDITIELQTARERVKLLIGLRNVL